MEHHDLIRRAEDLAERCRRSDCVTAGSFLTPAERFELERQFQYRSGPKPLFNGGHPDCERTVAFFLPDWMEEAYFDPADYLRAIRLRAYFGTPGHRDYLGALLGMGVGRERLGDIWVSGDTATVFCLPGVEKHLLGIDKVGHVSVSAEEISLDAVTPPVRQTQSVSFSVMSMRLDAVAAGLFHLSRSEAARQITLGMVSLNYQVSNKTDSTVREGDILSLRGVGKGKITGTGGTSRKGRLFVYGEIYR